MFSLLSTCCFFFHNTASTDIYTLSLHDALPIYKKPATLTAVGQMRGHAQGSLFPDSARFRDDAIPFGLFVGLIVRSEEHTSELQSRENLVCRLLLEKKKKKKKTSTSMAHLISFR